MPRTNATLQSMAQKIGSKVSAPTQASLYIEGMYFPVRVKDVRQVFGRTDLLVQPVGGSGEKWVAADRVKI